MRGHNLIFPTFLMLGKLWYLFVPWRQLLSSWSILLYYVIYMIKHGLHDVLCINYIMWIRIFKINFCYFTSDLEVNYCCHAKLLISIWYFSQEIRKQRRCHLFLERITTVTWAQCWSLGSHLSLINHSKSKNFWQCICWRTMNICISFAINLIGYIEMLFALSCLVECCAFRVL